MILVPQGEEVEPALRDRIGRMEKMGSSRMTRRQLLASAAAAGFVAALPRCKSQGTGVAQAPEATPAPTEAVLAPAGRAFKIGACDWSIGKTANIESIEVAARIGLDGVQVSFGPPNSGADLRDERVPYVAAASPKLQDAFLKLILPLLSRNCISGTGIQND